MIFAALADRDELEYWNQTVKDMTHIADALEARKPVDEVLDLINRYPNLVDAAPPGNWAPLLVAAQLYTDVDASAICSALLAAGARPDVVTVKTRKTALHCACERGMPKTVEVLLKDAEKAFIEMRTNIGNTAAHYAAAAMDNPSLAKAKVVELLKQCGADFTKVNSKGWVAQTRLDRNLKIFRFL